ncbi:MAG: hypothetical protein QM674_09350 [Burkholderiaceae bacterium]
MDHFLIALGACAHASKKWMLLAAVLPLALAGVIRWFGLDLKLHPNSQHDQDNESPEQPTRQQAKTKRPNGVIDWFTLALKPQPEPGASVPEAHERKAEFRAACRQGAMAVIGRSRYVLAMLMLFAAFTLVSDQCRDVLLAMASLPDLGDATARGGLWWLFVLIVSPVGLALFAQSCWLWARLVCRVQSVGTQPLQPEVAQWVGAWACGWARALMLAPLVMSAFLLAYVVGDAVVAAALIVPKQQADSNAMWRLFWTLLALTLFAAIVVGLAYGLMWSHLQKPKSADDYAYYYSSEQDLQALISGERSTEAASNGTWFSPLARVLGRFLSWLTRPVRLPLVALGLLLVVRLFAVLAPETAAAVPASLAMLTLALAWWLGPLGLMAIHEQRTLFPWGLVVLTLVVVLSLWSDNHLLPALAFDSVAQVRKAVDELRCVSVAALVLLTLVAAGAWTLMVCKSKSSGVSTGGNWRGLANKRRICAVLKKRGTRAVLLYLVNKYRIRLAALLYLVLCGGLYGLDQWATSVATSTAEMPTAAEWKPPIDDKNGRVLIVAAEGGGIRAAYWTARTLAELQDERPDWIERIAAMSGVSGGAMGLAVWRGCANRKAYKAADCVEETFRSIDPLSPLLGGLLFDDVWTRLVPSDWLCSASGGCGVRSRALGFEREWMRVLPELGLRVGAGGEQAPLLLFNSTVVETGNRAVIATACLPELPEQSLPGADDLMRRTAASAPLSLVTAAHTSARFPFVNPLASLPKPDDADEVCGRPPQGERRNGLHLGDGGYHDNSGARTLADLLPLLRRTLGNDRRFQLVLIRNGQAVASDESNEKKVEATGNDPCRSSDLAAVRMPRDKSRLDLYADLTGPAVALFNVAGTGAHGRAAAASLAQQVWGDTKQVEQPIGCRPDDPICLLDQVHDGGLVPLGWSLSRWARESMARRAKTLVEKCLPKPEQKSLPELMTGR